MDDLYTFLVHSEKKKSFFLFLVMSLKEFCQKSFLPEKKKIIRNGLEIWKKDDATKDIPLEKMNNIKH